MNTLFLLFLGFGLAWAVSFAYLAWLGRRANALERELARIEARLPAEDRG